MVSITRLVAVSSIIYLFVTAAYAQKAPDAKSESDLLQAIEEAVTSVVRTANPSVVAIIGDSLEDTYATASLPTIKIATNGSETTHTISKTDIQNHISQLTLKCEELSSQLSSMKSHVKETGVENPEIEKVQSELEKSKKQRSLLRAAFKTADVFSKKGHIRLKMRAGSYSSGFCIANGYIITTANAVRGMDTPYLLLHNGKKVHAKIVGLLENLNIAMIQLPDQLTVPPIKRSGANSPRLEIGSLLVGLGNIGDQNNPVAAMLLGGIKTEPTYLPEKFYSSLLWMPSGLGELSDGSPILNRAGEVVGMHVRIDDPVTETIELGLKFSDPDSAPERTVIVIPQSVAPIAPTSPVPPMTGGGQFRQKRQMCALPLSELLPFVDFFLQSSSDHGWIGLSPDNRVAVSETQGMVTEVRSMIVGGLYPDSPAQRAGVMPGDTLVTLNGEAIQTSGQLFRRILRLKLGDKVDLILKRKGRLVKASLVFERRPKVIKEPITQKQEETKKD